MTTIANPVTGPVLGQPISPSFGQQFAGTQAVGAPITQLPTGTPLLVQVSTGAVPMNQLVNTINGVSTGGNPVTGDPCTIAQALSNGNGAETARGVSVAANGAASQQIFVDNITDRAAVLSNGPAPTDTSSLTECPVAASTLCQNVALYPQFGG